MTPTTALPRAAPARVADGKILLELVVAAGAHPSHSSTG